MVVTSDETIKLDLTARRRPLAEQFEKNPHHLPLALEIKAIDDKACRLNRSMQHHLV